MDKTISSAVLNDLNYISRKEVSFGSTKIKLLEDEATTKQIKSLLEATDTVEKSKSIEFLRDIFEPTQEEINPPLHNKLNSTNELEKTPSLAENTELVSPPSSSSRRIDKSSLSSGDLLVGNANTTGEITLARAAPNRTDNEITTHLASSSSSPNSDEPNMSVLADNAAMIKSFSSPSSSMSSAASSFPNYQPKEETSLDEKREKDNGSGHRNKRKAFEYESECFYNNGEKQYFVEAQRTNSVISRKKNKLNSIADGLLMKKESSLTENNSQVANASVNESLKIDNEMEDLFGANALASLTPLTPTTDDKTSSNLLASSAYQAVSFQMTSPIASSLNKNNAAKLLQAKNQTTEQAESFSMKLAFNFPACSTPNEQSKIVIETVSENAINILKFSQVKF